MTSLTMSVLEAHFVNLIMHFESDHADDFDFFYISILNPYPNPKPKPKPKP